MSQRWVTFDCYGTLIDWDRGLAGAMESLWPRANRDELLRVYHAVEPLTQRGRSIPYREVLARSLEAIGAIENLPLQASEKFALAESLPGWPAFPETATTLRSVRDQGWQIGILSNTDPELLSRSLLQIGVEPDITITAMDAGSHKPALGHWKRFYEMTNADPASHVHVAASLFHDIVPASQLGIQAVWINRLQEKSDLPRAAELPDLRRLPSVLEGLSTEGP